MGVFSLISNSANLRQNLMPFHLKPGGVNGHYSNSTAVPNQLPQFFSFKKSKEKSCSEGGFGLLNICPSSFKQFMESDIGYKLLYNYTKSAGITKESINANAVFDNLPSLQIREYAIDSELDQLVNLFRDLVNVFNPGDKNAPTNSVKKDSTDAQPAQGAAVSESKSIADKIKSIWEDLGKNLDSEDFYTTIFGNKVDKYAQRYRNSPEYNKVIRFPFAVYYKLLSCVTTNMYEVPIHPDVIVQSKSEGFEGSEPYGVSFSGQGMIGSIPIIGKVISRVMSSIAVNTSPVWDPSKTSKTGPTTSCKFKLFNDTVDAAIYNFIFVNTIAANNMWYNYSIFKRAPALYDIKINGVYRYFMCTAEVMVKPTGPVRKVPLSLIKKLFSQYNSLGEANKNTAETASKARIDAENAILEAEKALADKKKQVEESVNKLNDKAAEIYKKMPEAVEGSPEAKQMQAELDSINSQINQLNAELKKQQQETEEAKRISSETIEQAAAVAESMASGMDAVENEFVAIPDIYDVELSFTSMLPNNFNNFLYVYAGNPDIMRSDKGYQGNVVVDFIKALKKLIKI